MALPGTPGQRISDLCNGNHITQKELAEKIGVSASQLSRIVSGETRTVSSDILIGVAKEFKNLFKFYSKIILWQRYASWLRAYRPCIHSQWSVS